MPSAAEDDIVVPGYNVVLRGSDDVARAIPLPGVPAPARGDVRAMPRRGRRDTFRPGRRLASGAAPPGLLATRSLPWLPRERLPLAEAQAQATVGEREGPAGTGGRPACPAASQPPALGHVACPM